MLLLLEIKITYVQAGVLFGAAFGAILGLLPLILGIIKKNLKLGIIGFFGAIIGNAILGFLLSIPIVGICTYLILKGNKESADVNNENEDSTNINVDIE